MIRKKWQSLFKKVPSADFMLCKIDDTRPEEEDTSIDKQITEYSLGRGQNGKGMVPYELISRHFPQQPPNDKIHIYVLI